MVSWIHVALNYKTLPDLPPLTISWVGDANNILNSMLVTYPRLGLHLRIATPKGYPIAEDVYQFAQKGREGGSIFSTTNPREAVQGADVIVTDTWVSMGQESEKQKRLEEFRGFQVTEQMAKEGGAKSDWKFMHCLPRKPYEVDDQVCDVH
jgi:ornithine carbamoyltransferase